MWCSMRVFPFSSPPTTTPDPDPSSLFPTDTVVQPPFLWSPAGTAYHVRE
jgi:hypothetical protein